MYSLSLDSNPVSKCYHRKFVITFERNKRHETQQPQTLIALYRLVQICTDLYRLEQT